MTFNFHTRVIGFCIAASIAGCGGGGGSAPVADSSSSSSTAIGITVVPALGAFTAGARVEAFDPVTGLSIGNGATTDATGTAAIDLGNHASAFILKVSGSTTAKYFEEGFANGTGTETDFTSNDVMLALVPASAAVTQNSSIGVTPLTHMAAGFAVNSLSDLKVNVPAGKTAADVMYEAMARTRYIIGLAPQSNDYRISINPILAPTALSAANKASGINLSSAGGYYGLLLAELSKAVSTETPARSSLDLAKSLYNHAVAIKALVSAGSLALNSTAVTNFQASIDYTAITAATSAVGAGTSTFLNSCKTLPQQDSIALNAVFTNANTLNNFVPTSNELAQMVVDLKFAVDSKITKKLVSPFTETPITPPPSGC